MSGEPTSWPELESLLESNDSKQAAILQIYPQSQFWSFFTAIESLAPELAKRTQASGRRFASAGRLSHCPLLAVTGKLNAGKTSLVASFLSDVGRQRTLRGEANHQGTHRFALWLPERWRSDVELWGMLCARIGESLGAVPEELADDPDVAHAQYNNRLGGAMQLSVPLIATDPALDEIGLGFLDCPDTDTSETLGMGSPAERLDLLRRAAPLCSGFLVVAAHHALNDARLERVLHTLSEAMPNVPRLLAVNMVRPRYFPHDVLSDAGNLIRRHAIREVYLAYDYDIPESQQFRSSPRTVDKVESNHFPEFFIPVDIPDNNLAGAITESRWLRTLPQRLDPGEMFRQLAIDLHSDVQRTTQAGVDYLRQVANHRTEFASRTREQLLHMGLMFFVAKWANNDKVAELRLLQNPAIANQLINAFTRTAPWYAWLPLKIQQGVRSFSAPISAIHIGAIRWLSSGAAKEAAEHVKSRLRAGAAGKLISEDSMIESLQQVGVEQWLEAKNLSLSETRIRCIEVIERLEQETDNLLEQSALENAAKEVWRNVPAGKKLTGGLTVLGSAIVAFGAVLLIPFDGGVAVLAAASVKELLGAAGLSTAAAWWSGQQFQKAVAGQTAIRQLSDFIAAMCDALELPRQSKDFTPLRIPLVDGDQELPESSLPERIKSTGQLGLFKIQLEFIQAIDRWGRRPRR